MYKMTKIQRRDLGYIRDWVRGERELEADFVKNNYIPSYDPGPMGEFYTPEAIVNEITAVLFYARGARILDPCVGIGAMTRQFLEAEADWEYEVHAYELSQSAYRIFSRLYPGVKGGYADVFDKLGVLEGQFDYVIMNPPFGAVAGQETAIQVCVSGVTSSQHRFLELAVRATAPGGHIVAVASPQYIKSIPAKAKAWFDDRMAVEYQAPLQNGHFKFAKGIAVDGFIIHRCHDPLSTGQINLFELT